MVTKTVTKIPITQNRSFPIYALTPFTMLDFPGKTACVVWFVGCNMRCSYCHNPQIVKGKGCVSVEDVLTFLTGRIGLLDGVVISGGEASIHRVLSDFVSQVKHLGFALKLDTNGLRPEVIANFLRQACLDIIALDYKAPPEKFKKVTGVDRYAVFSEALDMLCRQKAVALEVRTTVHTDLINEIDINFIIDDLDRRGYQGIYAIQNFIGRGPHTLRPLSDPKRILDICAIKTPKNFALEFRSF